MGWLGGVRLTSGSTKNKSCGAKRSRRSCVVRSMHDRVCKGQMCVKWWHVLTF